MNQMMISLLMGIVQKLIESVLTEEVMTEAKKKFIAWLREEAKKSDNELDDSLVDILAKFLGV